MEIPSKRIRVRDIEVVYDELGTGTRPLVLVHGFTGFRRDFESQLPALGELGWTLAPDQRGHGETSRSADPSRYTLDALADDLLAFLEALGSDSCDLLGHSMGGMVALRAVLRQPERVASLLLMDTAPAAPDGIPVDLFRSAWELARSAGMAALQRILQARADEDTTRTDADRRLEREWGAERYWERHRARFLATDPEAYAALGRELVEQASLAPRLGEVRCPTLVMVGQLDTSFLAAAETLAAGIPGARRVAIPGAGHQPQLETPGAWLRAVREHLARARG